MTFRDEFFDRFVYWILIPVQTIISKRSNHVYARPHNLHYCSVCRCLMLSHSCSIYSACLLFSQVIHSQTHKHISMYMYMYMARNRFFPRLLMECAAFFDWKTAAVNVSSVNWMVGYLVCVHLYCSHLSQFSPLTCEHLSKCMYREKGRVRESERAHVIAITCTLCICIYIENWSLVMRAYTIDIRASEL